MISNKTVGQRIKNIRQSKGMTMAEFGKAIDTETPASDSIVSRWERGVSLPSNDRLPKIAELGDISVTELLFGNYETNDVIDYLSSWKEDIKQKIEEQEYEKGKYAGYFTGIELDLMKYIEQKEYLEKAIKLLKDK